MYFEEATEQEYQEQQAEMAKAQASLDAEGEAANAEAAAQQELVVTQVKDVASIAEMQAEIKEWLSPQVNTDLKAIVASAQEIVQVTTPEEREAAAKHATALQKGRTQGSVAKHKKFKAPVLAITKTLDARNRELSAIVEPEENRIRALIDRYDEAEKEKVRLAEEARRKKVSDRITAAMQAKVTVDTEFAEVATDEEWDAHLAEAIQERDSAEAKRLAEEERKLNVQKQITSRLEIASKLGAELSIEDAEFLTDDEFGSMRDDWEHAYLVTQETERRKAERASLIQRAADAGFVLPQVDLAFMEEKVAAGSFENLEAAFMIWLGDMTKLRAHQEKEAKAAARLTERLAQVEELGMPCPPLKQVKESSEEEWADILRAFAPVPVADPVVATPAVLVVEERVVDPVFARHSIREEREPVEATLVTTMTTIQAPVIPRPAAAAPVAVDPGLTSGGTNPAAAPNVTLEQVAVAESANGPTGLEKSLTEEKLALTEKINGLFDSFRTFGNGHCTKDPLKSAFMPVFLELKAIKESL